MRWKTRYHHTLNEKLDALQVARENSYTRVIRKFLLLPKLLKGEWKWLETANIRQKFGTASDVKFGDERFYSFPKDTQIDFVKTFIDLYGWQDFEWGDDVIISK